jgi:hypothetical protein
MASTVLWARSPSASCAALAPVGSHGDTYGGRIVTYRGAGGTTVDVRVPPRGYQVAKASDVENAWYGIPPRPRTSAALAEWQRDWGSIGAFDDRAPCGSNAHHRPTSQKRSCEIADRCSLNWAGIYADAATFTGMSADFQIPSQEYACGGDADHASWVGVGGVHHEPLLQNGADTSYDGSLGTPYLFWAAEGPQGEYYELDYPPSSYGQPSMGDTIAAATTFDRSRGVVTFAFHDVSGSYAAINATPTSIAGHPDSYFYDAASAEAIDERPYADSSLFLMPNFESSPVAWTNARSYSTSYPDGIAIRDGSGASVGMTEGDSGATIVSPTTIPGHDTPDSFQDNWSSCGDSDLD